MALLERLEIVIEADARTAEREFDRIGRQATESLESIETAAAEVGDNASKRLADAAPEFARAGERLSDAAGKELDLSAAAERAAADLSRAVDGQRSEMEQAGRRAGDAAGGGVADGVRGAGSQVRGAGGALGSDVGDGVSGGILESLGGLGGDLAGAMDDALGALPAGLAGPVAAAGALIGAGLVSGITAAIETENLGDVIAARVGEGAAESERFARVTSEVFRDAWGESTAEVADAVDAVYSTLADSRGSEAALQDLTERAQAFAQVFNQDVGQAVSNAGVLIETGLARDAVDAFDLMTAAAQRVPAAMRDELGEATQEYSTFFGALGFDGREAFSILTDAAQEGRYELDKTGDAMKELSIRATDLADTAAMNALEDLGLDARDTANALLEGGEAARTATQQIFDALSTVPEPAKQAEIAIALMGAPLEDLNKQEIPEFIERLASASSGMRDAKGSSDDLRESLRNQQTAWTTVKRELLGVFEDYANQRLAPLSDLIQTDDPGLADYGEAAADTVLDAMKAQFVGGVGQYLIPEGWWDKYGPVASFEAAWRGDWFGSGEGEAEELGYAMGEAIGRGITAAQEAQRGNIATGFAPDGTDWQLGPDGEWEAPADAMDAMTDAAGPAKMSLEEINSEIQLSNDLFQLAEQRAGNYLDRIADTTSLDDAISAQLNLRDAAFQLADGLGALQGVDIEAFADGTIQVSDEAADALGDIAGAAAAAQQQIANTLQFEGEAAALEKANELRDSFTEMFRSAGLTDEQIQDLLRSMGLLPDQVTTAIQLSGADEALAKLDLLSGRYADSIPAEVQTQIDIAIAEGRFVDAANLLSLWVKDQEDGFIDDPLLIAMGLGDTSGAQADVDGFIEANDGRRITIDVFANVGGAAGDALLDGINRITKPRPNGDNWGIPLDGGRAMGGPMLEGAAYEVNERGQELFVSADGGFMVNASNLKQLMDNMQRLVDGAGGGGMSVVQNIAAPDPYVAASESARKMRDAMYMAGV